MLVGRRFEMAAVDRLLTDARSGHGGALVVRGEAGIGKSAVLEYARAAGDGILVLRALGVESEAEFAFAGLHQLLHPLIDRIDLLPPPQAAALRAAFALSDETVPEPFRIALGVLGVLAEAAGEQPVLCVVDDAQWLDRPSGAALVFAARRLAAEPVAMLFAARDDATRGFAAPGLKDLRLGPLQADDARTLVASRLVRGAADEAVDWVLANANGNPLALIELPQALTPAQVTGREPLAGVAPPKTSVERAYLDRVDSLPAAVQQLLLLASAEETGDRVTIAHAAQELGLDADDLGVAAAHGLVNVEFDQINFRHPLLRSAVYRRAGVRDRKRAHRALADVLSAPVDADRRAWHRAAATSGADDEVADELEATAGRAYSRAGYSGSATALERAAMLSSDTGERERRLVRAARSAWQAGQRERAIALLSSVAGALSDPLMQVERDHVRGLVELGCGSLLAAGSLLLTAANAVAPRDPQMALEMLLDAGLAAGRSGNVVLMAETCRRADTLPPSGEEKDEVLRDLLIGVGGFTAGRTAAELSRIRSAIARAQHHEDPRLLGWAAFGAAIIGSEATDAALARSLTAVRNFGAVPPLVLILETEVIASHLAGRYSIAAEAEEGLRLAREVGLSTAATAFLGVLSWVAGLQGRDEACRRYAAEVSAVIDNGMAMANSIAQWAVALLDLARGAVDKTIARLSALRGAPVGEGHPLFVLMSTPDLVEAFLQAGRNADAVEAFAPFQAFAQDGAPAWALAFAARCRALLQDPEHAEHEFQDALDRFAEANRPFDTARTRLMYGQFLRRLRRRSDARAPLRIAVETFERLGAEPWAERARVELRATGEAARTRDPSTVTQLTPQELQIARLVGAGNSNKDVAAQLFLSPRTVEYHLAKVFAKLGIASRADLIRQAAVLEPVG